MKNIQWKRILKMAAISLIFLTIVGDLIVAYGYVYFLTHVPCPRDRAYAKHLPTPEEHFVQTHDQRTLKVWYYPSQNGAAVIALDGMGGSLGSGLPLVGPLIEAGYGVLQIDSRMCADPPAPVTLGYYESFDAEAGLAFLLDRPEVDPERIGIYGFSMGGAAAIQAAARSPEIVAVLAEGGYFNLGLDFMDADRDPSPLMLPFLYTVAGMFRLQTGVNPWDSDPIGDLPSISPRPVFLIYGDGEIANGRGREQYEAALEPKTLWVVPGGTHGTNHLAAPEEYDRRVLEFFKETLGE